MTSFGSTGQSASRWSAFSDDELMALEWVLDIAHDDDVAAIVDEIGEELREMRGYTFKNGPGWVKR
jgi:hypothetical protein